jgi:hypothetical protein
MYLEWASLASLKAAARETFGAWSENAVTKLVMSSGDSDDHTGLANLKRCSSEWKSFTVAMSSVIKKKHLSR